MPPISHRVALLENSVSSLAAKVNAIETQQQTIIDSTDEILAFVSGAKKSGGAIWEFTKKHGGRVIAAGVGYAIASGWITTELGHALRAIVGV